MKSFKNTFYKPQHNIGEDIDLSSFNVIVRPNNYPIEEDSYEMKFIKESKERDFLPDGFCIIHRNEPEEEIKLSEGFNLALRIVEGQAGRSGLDGQNGRDGYTPVKNLDYFDGKDGKDGKNGSRGKDGINGIDGKDGKNGAKGKDGEKGLDGTNGKDGKDGYTPIKGVDYFDGKDGKNGKNGSDGINGIDGKDGKNGKDGKSPVIKVGEVTSGKTASIIERNENGEILLDFILPTGRAGNKGKDGINGIDGKDGKNGKDGINGLNGADGKDGKNGKDGINGEKGIDGYTPKKGIDYFDGEKGLDGKNGTAPEHEIDDVGNIRFKNPDNSWGEWIRIYDMFQRLVKHHTQRDGMYGGGGGSNLDFIIDSNIYTNVPYMNFDTQTMVATVDSNGIITIGVNPNFVGQGGVDPSGAIYNYTYDYYKLPNSDVKSFVLSKPLIVNSESVILDGKVLTYNVDYDIFNNIVVLNNTVTTLTDMNVTIKYAFDSSLIISGISTYGISDYTVGS